MINVDNIFGKAAENKQHIVNITRTCAAPSDNVSQRIVMHMRALDSSPAKANNSFRGKFFEACISDALLVYGVPRTAIEAQYDLGGKADVDFVVHGCPKWQIHCKTSIRERWAVPDRAAIFASYTTLSSSASVLLIYKERKDQTLKQMVKHAKETQAKCIALDHVINVHDEESMLKLFEKVKASAAAYRN